MLTILWISFLVSPPPAQPPVDYPSDLERWYATEPPTKGSEEWLGANNDVEHEWAVSLEGARPRVTLLRKRIVAPLPFKFEGGTAEEGLAGRHTVAKVKDGWIVGFNAGEFGGGLWWFSPEGDQRYKISSDNVVSLIPTDQGLLALVGLAHGVASKGRILRLHRAGNERWVSEGFFDLRQAPEVAVMDVDGSLVVATTERLLRIAPTTKKAEILVPHAFWGGLYPNSMVIAPSCAIYLGMRHGVAKIEKRKPRARVSWLLPTKEFANRPRASGFK